MIKTKLFRKLESIIKLFLISLRKLSDKSQNFRQSINSAIYKTYYSNFMLANDSKNKYLIKTGSEISKYLYINGNWNYHVLVKACRLLKKNFQNCTLINVGAHYGSTCIPAINFKLFKNAIAFEPDSTNYKILSTNIFINSLSTKIRSYNIALSSHKRNLYIKQFGVNSGDVRVLEKKQKNSTLVKCEKLDKFTSEYNKHNSLIFMYAQGHESEIFLGAKKTIKKKIPMIVEFMPSLFKKNWKKNYSILIKQYNFFYDLKKNRDKKNFSLQNLSLLEKEYLINSNYTDLLLFN